MYNRVIGKGLVGFSVLVLGIGIVPGDLANSYSSIDVDQGVEVTSSSFDEYTKKRIIDPESVRADYLDVRAYGGTSCNSALEKRAEELGEKRGVEYIAVVNSRGDRWNFDAFSGGRMCYGSALRDVERKDGVVLSYHVMYPELAYR